MYFAKQDMQNYFRVEHSTPIMFCGYTILAPKIIICLIRILDKNKQLVLSCNCILPIYFLFKFQFNSISEQNKNVSFHFFNFGKKKKKNFGFNNLFYFLHLKIPIKRLLSTCSSKAGSIYQDTER